MAGNTDLLQRLTNFMRVGDDVEGLMAAIDVDNAKRAEGLRNGTIVVDPTKGCDGGCGAVGTAADVTRWTECMEGCGDVVCPDCIPTWLNTARKCHNCDPTPMTSIGQHMSALRRRGKTGTATKPFAKKSASPKMATTAVASATTETKQQGNTCSQCTNPASSRCSQCRLVHYCSVACQRNHWPLHKLTCTKV